MNIEEKAKEKSLKKSLIRKLSLTDPTGALTLGGVILIYISALAIMGLIGISIVRRDEVMFGGVDYSNMFAVMNFYLTNYSAQILLLLTALLSSAIGYGLLRAAGTATKDTIPTNDRPLIEKLLRENNQEGINNYVKLSSLSGLIGAFTKLGLPGLPLVTVALTLFFTTLAIIMQNSQISGSLFDLAKLTLGAFIGSYVQRSSSEVQRMVVDAQSLIARGQVSPTGTGTGQSQDTSSTEPKVPVPVEVKADVSVTDAATTDDSKKNTPDKPDSV